MQDQDLHDKLKELTARYMALLKDLTTRRGQVLPQRAVPKVEFGANGSLSVDNESRPDFGLLVTTTLHDFTNDPANEASILAARRRQCKPYEVHASR